MNDKYRSRKYALAVISMFGLHTALFTNYIGGSEYIAGLSLVLGLYATANVMDKK